MRSSRTLAFLAVLATSSTALAAEVTVEQVAPAKAAAPSLPLLGIMADVGVPDGAVGSLVLRPWKALRASVGGSYNMVSKGVRAGLSILPFGRGPSATVEVGHYFEGDANGQAQKIVGSTGKFSPLLERVGYDYANAHLGLDFGYQRVTFYIHGGMSYVQGKAHNVGQLFGSDPQINGTNSSGLEVKVSQDPTIKYIGPSAKIGLIVYLW
jgi:opacity protein-like surface antigen